ncbi:hypothetical protein [Mycoplasma ovis]|nr:hypothetical protein [Mycoplasma ovis]
MGTYKAVLHNAITRRQRSIRDKNTDIMSSLNKLRVQLLGRANTRGFAGTTREIYGQNIVDSQVREERFLAELQKILEKI